MRFEMPLLKRFFGKLVHDILPAALASLLGGFLITHFHLDRAAAPVTVPVAHASPEMMQLLRDEHGLIVDYVKTEVASEKSRLGANAEQRPPHVAAEARPPAAAAFTPGALHPAAIIAPAPTKPAAPRVKTAAAEVSSPQLANAQTQQAQTQQAESVAPPVDRSDDSLLAKTAGIKDYVIAGTQRVVSAIGVIPAWFGSIGDRIGGEDPNPRPPANLASEL